MTPRKTFKLLATVSSENLDRLRAPIDRFLGPNAKIQRIDDGFNTTAAAFASARGCVTIAAGSTGIAGASDRGSA